MSDCQETIKTAHNRLSGKVILALGLLLSLGAYVRFSGLGARSLWLDEFCTWHVSRMPLPESLKWEPELTIPPLYQLSLRMLTDDAHPPEWLLRFPAAMCGLLSIAGGYWLGSILGRSRVVGLALAGLLACNVLQIDYSQEARPYSMLVLGCMLSVGLWYRLITSPRRLIWFAYVLVTTLSIYAHYLTTLTILAQVLWWVFVFRRSSHQSVRLPLSALVLTGIACVPAAIRTAYSMDSISQGVGWLEQPSLLDGVVVLADLTFGWVWVIALLLPAVVLSIWRSQPKSSQDSSGSVGATTCGRDAVALLMLWLVCAWFGLLLVSWLVQPFLATRYALPAAIPALLLPLVVAHRLDRRVPLIIAAIFIAGTAPDWLSAPRDVTPGFRELRNYLAEDVDPQSEVVVLTNDAVTYPNWPELERLAFQYYPLNDRPIHELVVDADDTLPDDSILFDPRALHLIVFRADPTELIEAAGREVRSIEHDGTSYSRRFFEPYRIVELEPLRGE